MAGAAESLACELIVTIKVAVPLARGIFVHDPLKEFFRILVLRGVIALIAVIEQVLNGIRVVQFGSVVATPNVANEEGQAHDWHDKDERADRAAPAVKVSGDQVPDQWRENELHRLVD